MDDCREVLVQDRGGYSPSRRTRIHWIAGAFRQLSHSVWIRTPADRRSSIQVSTRAHRPLVIRAAVVETFQSRDNGR